MFLVIRSMGITGLWEVSNRQLACINWSKSEPGPQTVEPAAERIPFGAFTTAEAVKRRDVEHRNLILGVDMRYIFFCPFPSK